MDKPNCELVIVGFKILIDLPCTIVAGEQDSHVHYQINCIFEILHANSQATRQTIDKGDQQGSVDICVLLHVYFTMRWFSLGKTTLLWRNKLIPLMTQDGHHFPSCGDSEYNRSYSYTIIHNQHIASKTVLSTIIFSVQ